MVVGCVGTGYVLRVELLVQRRLCPIFVRDVGSPDIHECFRGLTGSQRTPRFWGVTPFASLSSLPPLSSLTICVCSIPFYVSILIKCLIFLIITPFLFPLFFFFRIFSLFLCSCKSCLLPFHSFTTSYSYCTHLVITCAKFGIFSTCLCLFLTLFHLLTTINLLLFMRLPSQLNEP